MTHRSAAAVARRPWLAVCVMFAMSAVARFFMAEETVTPWIFGDEIVYSELARSISEGGGLVIRGYQLLLSLATPILAAPGYLLGDVATAYSWIHGTNAVVMSTVAFPAFGLARMALSVWPALGFTALVLAWPSFGYVGVIMTEPAFYPAMMLAVWALARVLERPTRRRQVELMGATVLCLAVRLQAIVLFAAIVGACLLVSALARGDGRWRSRFATGLRSFWPALTFAIALPVLVLVVQMARGRGARSSLGGYEVLDRGPAGLDAVWDWTHRHVAVVALSLAVVPAAIAIATVIRSLRRRYGGESEAAVVYAIAPITVLLVLQVAVFASTYAGRIEERNMFLVEPLLLLVAFIGISRIGYSPPVAIGAAVVLAIPIWSLPLDQLLAPPPLSDTFTLLAALELRDSTGLTGSDLVRALALGGVVATAIVVLLRRRAALVGVMGGLLALLVWMGMQIQPQLTKAPEDILQILGGRPPDWIDRAVGPESRVAFIWPSDENPALAYQAEFWNESVGSILAVPSPLPTLQDRLGSLNPDTGYFESISPGPVVPEGLVVAPSRWALRGQELAHTKEGERRLTLWRIERPLRAAMASTGFFSDGWTGAEAQTRVFSCQRGEFQLVLGLGFGTRQTVIVTGSGGFERRVTIEANRGGGTVRARVPVSSARGTDVCVITLRTLETATGHQIAGTGDARVLGVRARPPPFRRIGAGT